MFHLYQNLTTFYSTEESFIQLHLPNELTKGNAKHKETSYKARLQDNPIRLCLEKLLNNFFHKLKLIYTPQILEK